MAPGTPRLRTWLPCRWLMQVRKCEQKNCSFLLEHPISLNVSNMCLGRCAIWIEFHAVSGAKALEDKGEEYAIAVPGSLSN